MSEQSVTWEDRTGEWKYTVKWEIARDGGLTISITGDDYLGVIGTVSMTDLDVDDVADQLRRARDAGYEAMEGAA